MTSLVITDPTFDAERAARSTLTKWATGFINDERDVPFLVLGATITALIVPMAVLIYARFSWWLLPVHYAIIGWYIGPYNLMLHNTSHRMLFKRQYVWANRYIGWFLGPFFGHAPHSYFMHHIAMHHPENNLPDDLSSTMPYQRDSVLSFLKYYLVHIGAIHTAGPIYFHRKKRFHLRNAFALTAWSFYAFMWAMMLWVNWRATLVVFVIPYFVIHFLMMCGNWGQHAFVDAETPENCYRNSITCINGSYNRRCFNDGYHIGHHLKATRHWTEMPEDFLRNRAEYAAQRAIVFHTIDFFVVWFFLMLKRYDWLAKYYVELDGQGRSQAEIMALLRSRTTRI
jgi:hypothetical protein